LKHLVSAQLADIDARAVNSIPIGTDQDGNEVVARVGRYGPYVARGEETAGIPDGLAPDELTVERAIELLEAPSGDRALGTDPESALPVVARSGRYGPYVQLGDHDDTDDKPKTASLFKTMSLDTITLEDALRLLTLPRVVGVDEEGHEITVQNGPHGPYLKRGKDSRSLETEEQLFTVTLDECLRLLAEPKRRRGQASAAVLRELGDDPVTGRPVVLKDGRFGPYVTDGEVNASLRKGDTVEAVTIDRAAELLQDRRDRGPAKKKAGAKKKASAKKSPAKKKAGAKKRASTRTKG
jgi:DNA topoisomerase-1